VTLGSALWRSVAVATMYPAQFEARLTTGAQVGVGVCWELGVSVGVGDGDVVGEAKGFGVTEGSGVGEAGGVNPGSTT
jgi:hypothetical protein